MKLKLEGEKKLYTPKDTDEVKCETHGVVTTWGDLDPIQQLAFAEGIDTVETSRCLLLPRDVGQGALK
jgi:hypothetical protein